MYRGICVVALLFALSTLSHETETEDIEALRLKCVNEVQYTKTGIANITESLNDDPKLRCLLGCLWRELGAVNADNSFNTTKWIEKTPNFKPKLTGAFNECAAEKGADLCETAYKFYTCLDAKEAI